MRRSLWVVALIALAGCATSGRASTTPSTSTAFPSSTPISTPIATPISTVARAAGCGSPSPFGTDRAPNELHAIGAHAEAWGLVLGHIPPRPGDELKIVWRVTGTGPLRVEFTGPDGRRRPLMFGPEAHASSTYDRPGDEWGAGFSFPTRGCWHLRLRRDGGPLDFRIDV